MVRSIIDDVRRLWAGIVIAIVVPILLFRILGVVFGFVWTRWRTRGTFRRSLIRAGLSADEADSLADRYNVRIPLCEMLRQRHRVGH
ncbi:hypothetical protein KKG90_07530 [Candidatus Bipolaricaulota bacterium]|nr:hypothetical protein [Candidatus Bipolaricaulota bacterium]